VIALAVPTIPIVAIRSLRNFVLCGIGVAAHGRHFSAADFGAALRRGNLRFALAHDHGGVAIRPHFDAEHSIVMRGMDGHVRGIDLRLGFAVFRNREVQDALAQLNLNVFLRQVRDVDLGVRAQAKNIGEVELQFRPRAVAGRNFVAGHDRLIQYDCRPVAGITALRGDVAVNQADARHALVRLCRSLARWSAGLRFGGLRLRASLILRRLVLISWTLPRLTRPRLPHLHRGAGLIRGCWSFLGGLRQRADRQRA